MKIRIILISITLFVAFSKAGLSQETEYQGWTSINVVSPVSKDLSAKIELGSRWDLDDSFGLAKAFGDIALRYGVLKWLRLSAFYRYTDNFDDFAGHRLGAESRFRIPIIIRRIRLYSKARWEQNSVDGITEHRIRFKVYPKFRNKNWSYGIGAEAFIPFESEFDKMRYDMTVGYEIDKRNEIGIRAIYEDRNRKRVKQKLAAEIEYRFTL